MPWNKTNLDDDEEPEDEEPEEMPERQRIEQMQV
jgi:hypothetical protein